MKLETKYSVNGSCSLLAKISVEKEISNVKLWQKATFSKITGEIEIKEASEDGNDQREKEERGNLLITLSHEISKNKQQTELFRRENEHDQVKFKSRIFSEFPLFFV